MTSPAELLRLADTVDYEDLWRESGITQGTFTPAQQDRMMAAVNLRRYSKYTIRIDRLKKHVNEMQKENQRLLAKLDNHLSDFPETHRQGMVEIDSSITTHMDCDLGVQIAHDGRVWICINGVAFLRFKPKRVKLDECKGVVR